MKGVAAVDADDDDDGDDGDDGDGDGDGDEKGNDSDDESDEAVEECHMLCPECDEPVGEKDRYKTTRSHIWCYTGDQAAVYSCNKVEVGHGKKL